ncbi:MAG: protein jag [Campylobacteraceae bacterium]|jgi:spoIIIJ-associated protein|nr:protein jag [Campylobacteraceae bacterium]MBT3881705.1 protein jag [Campylobacteraceae bacterium]MBT4031080.1 protein jag [Campylobacteraceae bacterium]MBT4179292.1 protein jag [Campylobacteraceae bacterium]MBT4572736.1 protein jag [Campylobacteraceae bacterium]
MERQFSAHNLEDAYELAAKALQTSVINLEVKVIQKPRSGFLGLFKRDAIILASIPNIQNTELIDDIPETIESPSENEMIKDIDAKVNSLFSNLCFKIDKIEVSMHSDDTILIEFTGEDAPLLIGKEGYRYKALSYILFNWIHDNYSMMLRLEIASFLKTQEESIAMYLNPIIEDIKNGNMVKTKPLDGVLVHIALKILRDEFPDKYVAIKTNIKGDKYVLVNEYRS